MNDNIIYFRSNRRNDDRYNQYYKCIPDPKGKKHKWFRYKKDLNSWHPFDTTYSCGINRKELIERLKSDGFIFVSESELFTELL